MGNNRTFSIVIVVHSLNNLLRWLQWACLVGRVLYVHLECDVIATPSLSGPAHGVQSTQKMPHDQHELRQNGLQHRWKGLSILDMHLAGLFAQ